MGGECKRRPPLQISYVMDHKCWSGGAHAVRQCRAQEECMPCLHLCMVGCAGALLSDHYAAAST
jgi:hypothetical protein